MQAWITATGHRLLMLVKSRRCFFCSKWALKKNKNKTSVFWCINSSSHLPITMIVTSRHPSFMKMVCQSFFFFPPQPTQMIQTHTPSPCCLSCRRAADQLGCWISNRTYPINLTHTGITNWYQGRRTASGLLERQSISQPTVMLLS